jgi:protein-L-isoaspartate O-methyltransferase/radical SAM superfamily enzyme YgiQ (UPF0313 family)
VLLLWPGTDGAAAGNFGVPQLVLLATWLRERTGADVHIRDLVCEMAFGPVALDRLLDGDDGRGYDVIAFSIYSSFDHLKCEAIAQIARDRWPDSVIVCGGYHPSARPTDYVYDGSPFDVCVVGEGEKPLVKVVESVAGGAPLRGVVLGPEPIDDLAVLPASDWSLLERYRPVARKVASQAQLYFSRGCPFDCAFCMERAKREVSWRPLPVERAVEELVRLHEFLDLRGWTLYVADALFGMKKSWRRELLARLAALDLPIEKIWLLIRVDLVEDEDLRLFADANCGLGFGLESGDEDLLAAIRKAGRLDTYLERMNEVAAWARQRDVPWGANVICGHPGETPDSLATSARYLEALFLDEKGTTGFLSVDPFRLYPGSPIDEQRALYEQTYGAVFHRPEWWQDGDQEFLAEWVDPSSELDWATRERLQHDLLMPVLRGIEDNFVYGGKARDYFLRAVREQIRFGSSAHRMHYLDRYYAWQRYLGFGSRADEERRTHAALAELAQDRRRAVAAKVAKVADVAVGSPVMAAIARVPRELFVPVDQLRESTRDVAVAVDQSGGSTVSAMHAYARAFSLLRVGPGDRVLDLGAGTGYGTALLCELVGEGGAVFAVEIDPSLAAVARRNLEGYGASLVVGDAMDPPGWGVVGAMPTKLYAGFALEQLPSVWREALPVGARIVAPLVDGDGQRLASATVTRDGFDLTLHEPVSYVPRRGPGEVPEPATRSTRTVTRDRRLPVVRGET